MTRGFHFEKSGCQFAFKKFVSIFKWFLNKIMIKIEVN